MIWRAVSIAKYSEFYEVSDTGLVRRTKSGRVLRHALNRRGYPIVVLCVDGKPRAFSIHRLVALTFIDSASKLDVNHKNGSKVDNTPDNLEFVSKAENNRHARVSGLWHPNRGATPNAKIGPELARTLREQSSYRNGAALAREHGLSYGIVWNVLHGKTWAQA